MNCRNCHEAIEVNKSGELVHEATGSIYWPTGVEIDRAARSPGARRDRNRSEWQQSRQNRRLTWDYIVARFGGDSCMTALRTTPADRLPSLLKTAGKPRGFKSHPLRQRAFSVRCQMFHRRALSVMIALPAAICSSGDHWAAFESRQPMSGPAKAAREPDPRSDGYRARSSHPHSGHGTPLSDHMRHIWQRPWPSQAVAATALLGAEPASRRGTPVGRAHRAPSRAAGPSATLPEPGERDGSEAVRWEIG